MKPLAKAPHVNRLRLAASAAALLLLVFLRAEAQSPPSAANAAVDLVTPEALQARISEVEASTALDEGTKARLLDLYARTRAMQDAVGKHNAAAEAYARAREHALEEARAIRLELEEAAGSDPAREAFSADGASPGELEAMLTKAKADQATVGAQLEEVRQALATESDRPNRARQRLVQARQRREAITDELTSTAPSGEPPTVREARVYLLQIESLALGAEIRMLDQELLSQPMRIALLEARRDRDERRLSSVATDIERLERQVGEQRGAEADRMLRETEEVRRLAEGKHRRVLELAARNADLAREIEETTRGLDQAAADAEAAKKTSARVSELFRNTRQKLELAGLTEALGRIMLEQRRRLAQTRDLQGGIKETVHALAQAGLRQIQHEEERQQLRDPAAYLLELTGEAAGEDDPAVDDELLELVERRRALVARALDLDQAHVRALGELDFAQRALLDASTEYRAFLDERLLWVRSTAGPSLELLTQIPAQLADMVAPANWSELFRTLFRRMTRSLLPVLALLLLVAGKVTRRMMQRQLVATGRYIRKPSRDRFAFTLQALGWTLLMAAPWPLFLYLFGRDLGTALPASHFVVSVSYTLRFLSGQFYILSALRAACVPDGLAASHFAWPEESLVRLRRRLRRFMGVFLPANFVTSLAILLHMPTMGGGLSWLGLLAIAASLAAFTYSLFQPRTGVLCPYMQARPTSLVTRLNALWRALAIGLPLAVALLATLGYRFTATVLLERVVVTMYFAAGIVLLHQLIARWLLLSRRRLAVRAALERRRAVAAEEPNRAEGAPAPPGGVTGQGETEKDEVDLAALGEETRQLLFYFILALTVVGAWMIWSQVLPAFGYLDQVTLWYRTGTVEGEVVQLAVTLADVLLAVLIGATLLMVTKRLPALLEIVLLQRLRLTPGARYAATTLSSYAIVLLGLIVALSMVGVTWSQLQWLVAALSVGIGFGLQEIVANFISGLIILFERPIRVGDVVTVGDTDGVVTRIQIRATTIRNWERKELLVPNKEFITNRLLNWSLSDQTTRIFITVGLAYGGEVQRAMAVMAAVAEAHDLVLDDPAPFVSFEGFGDNALVLNLRCYTDSLGNRLQTTSELHQKIDAAFRQAGLVIAFPQRDVHLDTSSPLRVSIQE